MAAQPGPRDADGAAPQNDADPSLDQLLRRAEAERGRSAPAAAEIDTEDPVDPPS